MRNTQPVAIYRHSDLWSCNWTESKLKFVPRSVAQSCLTLLPQRTVASQAFLSMGFSKQEYWSELPFPPPGDLPDPGTEPVSPTLAGRFFIIELPGNPN